MHHSRVMAGAMTLLLLSAPASWGAAPQKAKVVPTAEPFEGVVIAEGLAAPWDMVWGPDNHIWVSEREGSRIISVDPKTGEKKLVGSIPDVKVGPQHEGVLGIALDPDLGKNGSKNNVYIAHTYMDGGREHARIVRFHYDPQTRKIAEPKVILSNMPAGDDHNGGRLRFGPDGKLYYSIGEQGHNQGANVCKPIDAQRIPTKAELDAGDHSAYAGKVLRLNPDGGIPDDNPVINGVRSHVYTYGHRNPQGLVFVGDLLFEAEHGPSSDDEINLLVAGGNYGWPHVAGFRDDQGYVYGNWSAAPDCEKLAKSYFPTDIPASVPQQKETEWKAEDFREPIKTFYTVPKRALRRHGLPVLADHRAVERRLLPGERPDPRLGQLPSRDQPQERRAVSCTPQCRRQDRAGRRGQVLPYAQPLPFGARFARREDHLRGYRRARQRSRQRRQTRQRHEEPRFDHRVHLRRQAIISGKERYGVPDGGKPFWRKVSLFWFSSPLLWHPADRKSGMVGTLPAWKLRKCDGEKGRPQRSIRMAPSSFSYERRLGALVPI